MIAVARRGNLAILAFATDFGDSEEAGRRWTRHAEIDEGMKDGVTSTERSDLVRSRREKRRLELENETLCRAAAYLAPSTLP